MKKILLACAAVLTLYAGYRMWQGVDPIAMRDNPDMIPLFVKAELGDEASQSELGLIYFMRFTMDKIDGSTSLACRNRSLYWLKKANSDQELVEKLERESNRSSKMRSKYCS
ncbi:MAG: hypothetical protein OXR68_01385, partial [Alphaproteobacteria bacterium]|nr:hypothetical protein [Alphaproteobacteria bacterium]MDD9919264.1 hypothetical protein [Alphaproteobacteria bacterium]